MRARVASVIIMAGMPPSHICNDMPIDVSGGLKLRLLVTSVCRRLFPGVKQVISITESITVSVF